MKRPKLIHSFFLLLIALSFPALSRAQECRYISWAMLMSFGDTDIGLMNPYSPIDEDSQGLIVQSSAIFDTENNQNSPMITDGATIYSRFDQQEKVITDNPVAPIQGAVFIGMRNSDGEKVLLTISSPPKSEIYNFPTVYAISYKTLENTVSEIELFPHGGSMVTAYSVNDSVAYAVNVRQAPFKLTFGRLSLVDSVVHVKVDSFEFPDIQIDSISWIKISPSGGKIALATEQGVYFFGTNMSDAGIDMSTQLKVNLDFLYNKLGGIKSIEFSPRENYFFVLTLQDGLFQVLSDGQIANPVEYGISAPQALQMAPDGNLYLIGSQDMEVISMPDYDFKTINHISPENREIVNIGTHYNIPNLCSGILPVACLTLDYSSFHENKTVSFIVESKYPFSSVNIESNDYLSNSQVDFTKIDFNVVNVNYEVQFDAGCVGFDYFNGTYWIGSPTELIVQKALRGKDFYFGPNNPVDLWFLIPSFMINDPNLIVKILNSEGVPIYEVNIRSDEINTFSQQQTLKPGTYWYVITSDTKYVYGMFIVNK